MGNPLELRQAIGKIIADSPNNGYNNFVLKGPIEKPLFHTFIGLYPVLSTSPYTGGIAHKVLALVDKKLPRAEDYKGHIVAVNSKILQLEIPQRVLKLQGSENLDLTNETAMLLATLGDIPIAFLGFGNSTLGNLEEMIAMWHSIAISTPTALNIIKGKILTSMKKVG